VLAGIVAAAGIAYAVDNTATRKYTASSQLLVTSPEAPYYRISITHVSVPLRTGPGGAATPPEVVTSAPDTDTLVSAANLYPLLVESDPVARQRDAMFGPLAGKVNARAIFAVATETRFEPSDVPVIEVFGESSTPGKAMSLAQKTSEAFMAWMGQQQQQAGVKRSERIAVAEIKQPRPDEVVATGGVSTSLLLLIGFAVALGVSVLAVVLDRTSPHGELEASERGRPEDGSGRPGPPRAVEAEEHAEDVSEPAADQRVGVAETPEPARQAASRPSPVGSEPPKTDPSALPAALIGRTRARDDAPAVVLDESSGVGESSADPPVVAPPVVADDRKQGTHAVETTSDPMPSSPSQAAEASEAGAKADLRAMVTDATRAHEDGRSIAVDESAPAGGSASEPPVEAEPDRTQRAHAAASPRPRTRKATAPRKPKAQATTTRLPGAKVDNGGGNTYQEREAEVAEVEASEHGVRAVPAPLGVDSSGDDDRPKLIADAASEAVSQQAPEPSPTDGSRPTTD
jgi:hypothetical protein